MPHSHDAVTTAQLHTVSGVDYAAVFTAAAVWFAEPAQADVAIWSLELDQQGRLYVESDERLYLEIYYQRFDKPHLQREAH
ncbi:hypothetical protein ACFWMR_04515 [Amycolatopsis thailandensis]|uniref:hypothetical protein n=1 Tax=Amycolatopsis thailandensis TaxID=589330 RepID=UPI003646D2E0